MQGLQVQLLFAFLGNDWKIGAQSSFGYCLGIIVVVRRENDSLDLFLVHLTLAFVERLNVNRRDDPRLKPQLAQRSAHKMRAHAGFHAHDAAGQSFKRCDQRHPLDLLAQHELPVPSKTNQVKYDFANINANRHQIIKTILRHATSPICSIGQA